MGIEKNKSHTWPYKMLKSISYVGASKLVIILSQLLFLGAFAKILPVEDLGIYALALAIVTPVVWALTFDVPVKIISSSLETKNLFVILFPNIIILSALSLTIFLVEAPVFYLLLLLLFIVKFGEIVSEIEYASLRREEKFKTFSIVSSIRFSFVYVFGAVAIISGNQVVASIAVLSILSIAFALWSVFRLAREGWEFDLKFNNILPYISRNMNLGVASGLKFFSANLMRYFVAFQFGISSLGYMTPVFYGLTALSNISTIFDNVFSPKILKRIDSDNRFSIGSNKRELTILLWVSMLIIILALLFSDYYYSFFFPGNDEGYHYLLMVFSLGWIFYVSRAILKVVSYKFKLQHLQVKIQLMFTFLLAIFMFIFSLLFGVIGVALAFVLSSLLICVYYVKVVPNDTINI